MVLGVVAALPSYAVIMLRPRSRVDETLDVLAAHGVAGLTGIVFIGFVAQQAWNGVADGLVYGERRPAARAARGGAGHARVRVRGDVRAAEADRAVLAAARDAEQEALGMDLVAHGEEAYATGEGAILVELPEPKPRKERALVNA